MEVKYCCICNSKLKIIKVDGILSPVCMKCRKIAIGYTIKEKSLIKDLQEDFLECDYYKIENILIILRNYLSKLKEGG